ncbi:Checkpoint protein HUS1 [Orchesella cincta]|uniref:Checkpoint protein n=1 Tax=Orchesella cincta TaxID=48709 RepID=A0A1D2MHS0_ORCCI|nr:Checkpoint protein HUS1 [Orchesella cincta]
MKFRAKSKDISSIQTFSQLLAALSHCSRKFVLRITPEKLCFILSDKEVSTATTSLLAWAEVPKDSTFLEYAMQGVSLEDNEIFLEISPEKIAGCLSSLKSSQSVEGLKIKLTKRVVPCLSFEIEFPGANLNGNATCVHDIPVDPIKRKFWHHYTELQIPAAFDITIQMPDLKLVRLALERMKNLGPRLLIKASSAGKLTLSVETSSVKCIVKFQEASFARP